VRLRATNLCILAALAGCAVVPVSASAEVKQTQASAVSQQVVVGGQAFGAPNAADVQVVPGTRAKLMADGSAAAPADAPAEVQQAIWAANRIIGKPYIYGGGHQRFEDRGYDCSGTVSYALKGGDLIDTPMDSGTFMKWGVAGKGDWVTVYTNPGHAYVVIAGLRLDTSAAGDPRGGKGPRWRPNLRTNRGFRARHVNGL
jgi:cell wall-associated NlpC family hydrolase